MRYFGRWVSAIPCLLGYFWMLWDKEKQTWHDKFATDVVVPVDAYPGEQLAELSAREAGARAPASHSVFTDRRGDPRA